MILYSFTNMYLEGIHAGIQTAHMINEMWLKYSNAENAFYLKRREILINWAKSDKTIFIYTGGYQRSLEDRLGQLQKFSHHYDLPYAYFRESKDALNGALTCVGIIVPDFSEIDCSGLNGNTGLEFKELLTNCQRAR